MPSKFSCDIAIVGGGLSGALLALALNARCPGLDVRLVEASRVIGGDALWSFAEADVAPEHRWLVAPAVAHMWRGYRIGGTGGETLAGGYYALSSERLDAHVRATLPANALMTGRRVAAVTRSSVVLVGGDRIRANGVIDTRGAVDCAALDLQWRQFVRQHLVLATAHGQRTPGLQSVEGPETETAFVRSLPLGEEAMLVEANLLGEAQEPEFGRLRAQINRHAQGHGWPVDYVAQEQHGVLPICLGGDFERYWNAGGVQVPKLGARAALFHPVSGYALPDAVRLARSVAGLERFDGPYLHDELFERARTVWQQRSFYRLYARLLYRAADGDARRDMFEHFCRLDPAIISRFHAAASTRVDKLKIIGTRPRVPLRRALAALRGKGV